MRQVEKNNFFSDFGYRTFFAYFSSFISFSKSTSSFAFFSPVRHRVHGVRLHPGHLRRHPLRGVPPGLLGQLDEPSLEPGIALEEARPLHLGGGH